MGEGRMKLCSISDSYQIICLPYYNSNNTIYPMNMYCSHTNYNIKTIML